MTTYEVIMSLEILDEIESGKAQLPAGFRIVGRPRQQRGWSGEWPSYLRFYVEVEDPDAPEWTEGQLVDPTFQAHYDDEGNITKVTVIDRVLLDRDHL